jgi:DNA-binding NtrC family response regulator
MEFIAVSPISQKIYKLALMLREMDVNVYIYGPKGSGKSFLARFIAPNAQIYNDKLNKADEVIVENIQNDFRFNFKRVIATGESELYGDIADKFPIKIELKSLDDRKEDIEEFVKLFISQAKKELNIDKDITPKIDISQNLHSLKRGIYKQFLCSDYDKNSIIEALKEFFDKNYTENESYASMLKIFDKALIEVLLDKYKSKLQVANHLKINRHTLTKKVNEIENES